MNLSAQTRFNWQAHRGGRGIMPENSLPAFRKSLEIKEVATLELDVVVSKDRQVVVSHEPFFSADFCLAPGGKEIAKGDQKKHNLYQLTYAEIKQYDCGSKGNKAYPEQQKMPVAKPLLGEVLQMAEQYCRDNNRPPVHYNIEIKSSPDGDGTYHPNVTEFSTLVYEVIKQHVPLSRVVLQSFVGVGGEPEVSREKRGRTRLHPGHLQSVFQDDSGQKRRGQNTRHGHEAGAVDDKRRSRHAPPQGLGRGRHHHRLPQPNCGSQVGS